MTCLKACLLGLSIAGLAFVASSLDVTPTDAFGKGVHDSITEEALRSLSERFPDDPDVTLPKCHSREAIKKANKAVDDDPNYKAAAHFDRDPRKTSREAFREGAKHVQDKKAEAKKAIEDCQTAQALTAIGQALHAIQDFYAHSNYVDLTDAEQRAARAAFDDPTTPPPANLRLTAYYPIPPAATYNPLSYNPTSLAGIAALWALGVTGVIAETDPRDGKPFDHGLYWGKHKDVAPVIGPFGVDLTPGDGGREITRGGVTKRAFEWAREAAVTHSKDFLESIIRQIGRDKWVEKFGDYKFPERPPPKCPPSVPLPSCFPPPHDYIDPTYPYPRPENSHWLPGVLGLAPPEGGILDDCEGTAVFIQSGAVSTAQWFYAFGISTRHFPPDYSEHPFKIVKVREFWPEGAEFQEPVTISIVYSLSEIEGVSESSLTVYEFDLYHDATWNLVPSTVDTTKRTVTFRTTHLGIYGIAIPPPPTGGIVELAVDGSDAPASAAEGSGSSGPPYTALAGAAAAAALALTAGAWYARRRLS